MNNSLLIVVPAFTCCVLMLFSVDEKLDELVH